MLKSRSKSVAPSNGDGFRPADRPGLCSGLARISEDFRADFVEICPRCRGEDGACLAERVRAAARSSPVVTMVG